MKIKHGKKTITSEIAYIAGFFDGEGCVRLKKASQGGSSYYVWVAITNSNKDTLDYIKEFFGGQVRKAENGVNKVVYHYLITSAEAVDMLRVIAPFLREKREQAELAITFHEMKDQLEPKVKENMYKEMRRLKGLKELEIQSAEVIGNIYENPELLDNELKK